VPLSSTAGQQGSFQMMSSFLGLMVDPSVDGRSGSTGGGATGFAPEQDASFPPDIALAYNSVLKAPAKIPAAFQQRWSAWGSAFGGYNKTSGDAVAGTTSVVHIHAEELDVALLIEIRLLPTVGCFRNR
jgi:hypothetical protein